MQSTTILPPRLTRKSAALVELDILNSLKIARQMDSSEQFALFIDAFYTLCSAKTQQYGGEIIKYIGDSTLAMFEATDCVAALGSVHDIRDCFPEFCREFGVEGHELRATVHTGDVIFGSFGPEGQKDVIGKTPNELFQTRGYGITITEQVYRKLPSDKRSTWKKKGGQVVYVME